MKRGLVISGGGSKGAWSIGVIDYLYNHKKLDWDVFIGSSTGALSTVLASTGDMKKAKDEYTSVDNKSIYSLSPFNKKNKFKIFNAIWRILTKKKSFGEADKLKKRLKKAFTSDDYYKTLNKNKTVIVTTTNITERKTEYKYQTQESYNDFIDWVFSSTTVPLLFDVFEKNNNQYLDGALIEPIPLQKAINEGCDEIDVILLTPIKKDKNKKMTNIIDVAITSLNIMYDEVYNNDLDIGKLYGLQKQVKINIYRTPEQLTDNLYVFDKTQMLDWYHKGFLYAKKQNQKSITLKRKNNYRYSL